MAGYPENVAGNLLGKIVEAARQSEITSPIRIELRKLEITVSILKSMVRDAEEKQKNIPELTTLLKQLAHDFSLAGNLIDELECEYLRLRLQNRNSDEKVCCISSRSNLVSYTNRISKIRERLDKIETAMSQFRLVERDNVHIKRFKCEMTPRTSITGSQVFSRLLRLKREMICLDNHDPIIGREEAKMMIIEKLLNKEGLSILSIHGNGGMGKTTLAKLVYNDDQVFDYFHKRIWICVSEDFDFQRIKREILSSATGEQLVDDLTENQLHTRLQLSLNDRIFLLVLDDFGISNPTKELELKEILNMGAKGSKILATTRSREIRNDTGSIHKIEKLNKKESIDLFEHGFKSKDLLSNLREVAEEIVVKCNGVPLAIKCLSSLLAFETSESVWMDVKDKMNVIWKHEEMTDGSILPELKLSYDLMPPYLKSCFLCFSFLPKDFMFYSYELIQIWMAQGILDTNEHNPERVGKRYFRELKSRGLLEDVENHSMGYWFKIHGLVHDLAIELAHKEQENQGSLQNLSFLDSSNIVLPSSMSNKVLSLSAPIGGVQPKINGVTLIKCICKFKQLRFLYLCNSSMEEIPASIDTLKHLRYFDLRGNTRIKRLPDSICNLQSLQTLILAFCSELEELPKNIKNMINLRLLWVTTKQANLGKDGIGSLKLLRFLAIGGCQNLTQLFEDIGNLYSLRTLIIYDCKSLLTVPKSLCTLSRLRNMAIWGCEQLKFTFSQNMLRGLQRLILCGFSSSTMLLQWITKLDANLKMLQIGDFRLIRELPIWFEFLKELEISNCPRLIDLPYEMDKFENLNELRITFCGSVSKACMDESNHAKLEISHIPNIYVDSRRIKKHDNAIDEHKHDGASGVERTKGLRHHAERKDDHAEVRRTRGVNHDDATKDGHAKVEQTKELNHDEATKDGHTEVNRTNGQKLGVEVANNDLVEGGQKEEIKHDGAPRVKDTKGVRYPEARKDDHVEAGQTQGVNHDEATKDGHTEVDRSNGQKLGVEAANNELGDGGKKEETKHDGTNEKGGAIAKVDQARGLELTLEF